MDISTLPKEAWTELANYPQYLFSVTMRPTDSFLTSAEPQRIQRVSFFFSIYTVGIGFVLSTYLPGLARPLTWASFLALLGILILASAPLTEILLFAHESVDDELRSKASATALTTLSVSYLVAVVLTAIAAALAEVADVKVDQVVTFFGTQTVALLFYALILSRQVGAKSTSIRLTFAVYLAIFVFVPVFIFIALLLSLVFNLPGADPL